MSIIKRKPADLEAQSPDYIEQFNIQFDKQEEMLEHDEQIDLGIVGSSEHDDNNPDKNTLRNQTVVQLKCPECGAPLNREQLKCEYCGAKVILSNDQPIFSSKSDTL